MPLFSLPDECFSNILLFLDDLYDISLYNCLFVNRYWCKLSIPIIWRKPFESYYAFEPKFSLIINTLLACLNEDEISSLFPCSIKFNNQPPLFEYGRFIRKIDHDKFVKNILNWLKSAKIDIEQDCRVHKLVNVLYHMIMRQGSNLQEFDLAIFKDYFYIDLPKFSIFTAYKPGITNLRSLHINIGVNSSSDNMKCQSTIGFLSMVPKFCNGIVNCNIIATGLLKSEFIRPFLDIIRLQPLEKMTMMFLNSLDKENVKKFMYALEFRSETLKKLSFCGLDFQDINFSFLPKLEYLEHLEIKFCSGLTSNHFETLSKKKLHLKTLYIQYNYNIDSNIIVNSLCSKSLFKFSLNDITQETVKIIKESCPYINFLHTGILLEQPLGSSIQLICELSSLKILNLQINTDAVGTSSLVRTLSDYLISVEYLSFTFHVDLPSLEYFTNNCKANLRKWIIQLNNDDNKLRKDYLMCVNNYQKVHNSLEVLGICDFDNYLEFIWSKEEFEIINSLKKQGVDVVSSDKCNITFFISM